MRKRNGVPAARQEPRSARYRELLHADYIIVTQMHQKMKTYIAIDLKSFYASVECMERSLDPLTTNLVVADVSRTEKTICLAVSPSLKAYGIPGRARLFEVVQKVKEVNAERLRRAPGGRFTGESADSRELKDPSLKLAYIAARPRMSLYIRKSTEIFEVYLKYVAPEDIFSYSIDEVFIDVTAYLSSSGVSAHELAKRMVQDVARSTGITATAGIGTNLYLAKVAMDIGAKHVEPDRDGVRIAFLDEMTYRRQLWDHRPLSSFWRVGLKTAEKLERFGMFTMGDVAEMSLRNEDLFYELFGVNAELLIDHAWGYEPCTMEMIKNYQPENSSAVSAQVLSCPYPYEKAKLIVKEMADAAALDLVEKKMLTDQVTLTIGYEQQDEKYKGETTTDWYGRRVPKHAHGTENLERPTSSSRLITEALLRIFERTVDPGLEVRRLSISMNRVIKESEWQPEYEQMDLFTDYAAREKDKERLSKERSLQEAMLEIRKKYGKNAVLKGINLEEGATGRERNEQVGGHRA